LGPGRWSAEHAQWATGRFSVRCAAGPRRWATGRFRTATFNGLRSRAAGRELLPLDCALQLLLGRASSASASWAFGPKLKKKMKFRFYFPEAVFDIILINLNKFDAILCATFIQRYFAQKIVNFLVLLENNNMKDY
jgi:hypothetical protein